MPMTSQELDDFFASIDLREDVRSPADEGRRRAFLHGWKDGADRGKDYDPSSLRQLTWQNLRYRAAKEFGVQPDEAITEAFEPFEETFQTNQGRRDG